MQEQKIMKGIVILVVIFSLSAVLWVSWLRVAHGEGLASTVPMSRNMGHMANAVVSIPSSQLVTTGYSLYTQACSSCHGDNAQGGYGPNLHGANLPDTRVATVIKNGVTGQMPAFGGKYTATQQQALIAYVQSLKK